MGAVASHSRTDWQTSERRSRRPPQRGRRTLPPQRGSKQRGQQLNRLSFLGSGKRLDPRRAKPDLTVIDCLGAQRHNLVAAKRIVIVHRLSTRRQRSHASTSLTQTRIRLRRERRRGKLFLYIERPFSTPKTDNATGNSYAPFTGDRSQSASCRRRVSAASRLKRRRSNARTRSARILAWARL